MMPPTAEISMRKQAEMSRFRFSKKHANKAMKEKQTPAIPIAWLCCFISMKFTSGVIASTVIKIPPILPVNPKK